MASDVINQVQELQQYSKIFCLINFSGSVEGINAVYHKFYSNYL